MKQSTLIWVSQGLRSEYIGLETVGMISMDQIIIQKELSIFLLSSFSSRFLFITLLIIAFLPFFFFNSKRGALREKKNGTGKEACYSLLSRVHIHSFFLSCLCITLFILSLYHRHLHIFIPFFVRQSVSVSLTSDFSSLQSKLDMLTVTSKLQMVELIFLDLVGLETLLIASIVLGLEENKRQMGWAGNEIGPVDWALNGLGVGLARLGWAGRRETQYTED